MAEQAIGVVGLATMGMNLARNLASHGASVAVYNRTRTRTDEFMSAYAGEGDFHPAFTLEELTKALRPPRAILIMVKAGAPVDEAIDALGIQAPGKLNRIGHGFFTMVQTVLDTFFDVLGDALH